MKPPMNGASNGPEKTVMLNTVIASPRCRFENISAKTAPTHVRGQAPKKPEKNLQMKTVCASLPTATAKLKIEKPKEEMSNGVLRP